MRVQFTEPCEEHIKRLSLDVKKKFEKQILFLLKNIRYPSLRAKKREELGDVWQARVDNNHRFYFQIKGDIYLILDISKHPK